MTIKLKGISANDIIKTRFLQTFLHFVFVKFLHVGGVIWSYIHQNLINLRYADNNSPGEFLEQKMYPFYLIVVGIRYTQRQSKIINAQSYQVGNNEKNLILLVRYVGDVPTAAVYQISSQQINQLLDRKSVV